MALNHAQAVALGQAAIQQWCNCVDVVGIKEVIKPTALLSRIAEHLAITRLLKGLSHALLEQACARRAGRPYKEALLSKHLVDGAVVLVVTQHLDRHAEPLLALIKESLVVWVLFLDLGVDDNERKLPCVVSDGQLCGNCTGCATAKPADDPRCLHDLIPHDNPDLDYS